ncbi:hypothetical protein ACOMHN_024598 [Nucella lapillus]
MSAARNANFTTQYSDFLKESYEKESSQRLAWFAKRRTTQVSTKSRQLEVFRKKITEASKPSEALLSRLPKISAEPRYHRRKGDFGAHPEQWPDVDAHREMRPVSPDTWQMLYDGFTKEEKGRYQYLRKRWNIIPEKKFAFPTLSSWDYGWRLGDHMKKEDITKPAFGRTRMLNDTFFTRNGIETQDKERGCCQ